MNPGQVTGLGYFPDRKIWPFIEVDRVDQWIHVLITIARSMLRSDQSPALAIIARVSFEHTDLAAVLKNTRLLSILSQPELQMLAQRTVRKLFSAGELLFSEGEPCHGLNIVSKGKVRIFKISVTGREQVLAIEFPGDTVTEIPVFDGGPYPVSAVAVEDTEIAFISRHDFQAFCMEHPEVALKVLTVVGKRLRRLVDIIEELSFTTIRQRLVSTLVRLAQSEGKQTTRGVEFLLPTSHQEMANQLGTVRELISRNLKRLQAEGFLEVDSRQIVIKDLKAMAGILDVAA